MRIPLPDNVTWEDRARVTLPAGLAVVWHGNAVEVANDLPAGDMAALRAALESFDPQALTPAELALAEARERMAGDPKQADAHARLTAIEQALGLV